MPKYEKGSIGYFLELAKKDGFDNIKDWNEWKKAKNKKNIKDKYNPCSKEFQEEAKRLGLTGNQYIQKLINEGKLPNPTDIEHMRFEKFIKDSGCKDIKEYLDKLAQDAGFENSAERKRNKRYDKGECLPKEFNEDCSSHFGYFTEDLMIKTFDGAIKMPLNNPGFDWSCKRGDKIDNKSRCLTYRKESNWCGWIFSIEYNNIADWFILSGWDNRDSLNPLHVWIFHKNDILAGGEFWKRNALCITNTSKGLKKFEKWEVANKLDKLKELCDEMQK